MHRWVASSFYAVVYVSNALKLLRQLGVCWHLVGAVTADCVISRWLLDANRMLHTSQLSILAAQNRCVGSIWTMAEIVCAIFIKINIEITSLTISQLQLFFCECGELRTELIVEIWCSRCLVKNTSAVVEIEVDRPICLELYASCKDLGRFMLRSCGSTIAAGLVTEVDLYCYTYVLCWRLSWIYALIICDRLWR